VQNGHIVPGERLEGILVVTAPEPIPRADEIDLLFESVAWAQYGKSGVRKVMFQAPLEIDLPKGVPFAAGEHRYPFVVDVPAWLPPEIEGGMFGIRHTIAARVDVDWAVDPKADFRWPPVHMAPRHAVRRPLTLRSRPNFFRGVVVEVTLLSSTIVLGDQIQGQIALRNGHDEAFHAIDLVLMSNATIGIGLASDRRSTPLSRVRLPSDRLRAGETLSFVFAFPSTPHLLPTFKNSFIDHDVSINVSVTASARSTDPTFAVPIEVLPEGSTVEGSISTRPLGSDRVRQIAAVMAQNSGLIAGEHSPTLVYGAVGPVNVCMVDAPRVGKLGIDVDFTFPDLQLGILLRRRGVVEELVGSPISPFLPPALWDRFLSFKPEDERPKIADATLKPFFDAVFGGSVDEARLSDHHFGCHLTIVDDEPATMVRIALDICAQAKRIGDAISALPFPETLKSAQPAWQAAAGEQSAFLLPTSPALHGVMFRAQVVGGEERTIRVDFRTIWRSSTPTLQAMIDVRNASIPEARRGDLENAAENSWLITVRTVFPDTHISGETVVLDGAEWPQDPRTLFPTLETFLRWILEARGERRVDAPYR
jgi:hypothetical protein